MESILRALYRGEINPIELPRSRARQAQDRVCAKLHEELSTALGALDPVLAGQLEQCAEAELDSFSLAEEEAFCQGFRLAVQLLTESHTTI